MNCPLLVFSSLCLHLLVILWLRQSILGRRRQETYIKILRQRANRYESKKSVT